MATINLLEIKESEIDSCLASIRRTDINDMLAILMRVCQQDGDARNYHGYWALRTAQRISRDAKREIVTAYRLHVINFYNRIN